MSEPLLYPQVPTVTDHYSYRFVCECHDWHFLEMDWDDEDPEWRMLNFADTYQARGWRDRIAAAWLMLRGKPHYHGSVLLNQENIAHLRRVLDKHVPKETT